MKLLLLLICFLLIGCNADAVADDKRDADTASRTIAESMESTESMEIIESNPDPYEIVVDIPEAVIAKGRDYQWYGDDTWTDYTIEADISNLERDGDYQWWNFQFRIRNADGKYYYTYITGSEIQLKESITWNDAHAIGNADTSPLTGTVHYKFVVEGETITCYLNHSETPAFIYTNDTNPEIMNKLSYGGVGWAVEDATCVIENFKITRKILNGDDKMKVPSAAVTAIKTPVAGVYPQGMFKYNRGLYNETLEWNPHVSDVFKPDTAYTATITLVPTNPQRTFDGVELSAIEGLPSENEGVTDITSKIVDDNMVITINFEKTGSDTAPFGGLLFEDNFDGTEIDLTKWQEPSKYNMLRQGRSAWDKNMTSLDGNGHLILGVKRNPDIAAYYKVTQPELVDNFISGGALRSRAAFENTYGYYEASIKFPVAKGTWGAFWLFADCVFNPEHEGVDGTEIDIIESIGNEKGESSSNIHWNGYGDAHKAAGSGTFDVDIYDGEFHTFALDWSPDEYVFYIDDKEMWRVDGGADFKNSGICQNPLYLKLTVEGAEFAGALPADWDYSEMVVDYVRVYNQPKFLK
jgi:Beta-glucanase/Beta-glucan synthetase